MTRHRQAGLSLLEVLLSLSLISVGMVGVNRLVDSYVVDTKNAAVADQLKTSAQAYRAYVRNNYSTILAVATQDKPYLISHTDLSLGNYLPPGSNGRTVYGQTICALVRKNNAGSLEALVVTEGGATLNNLDLGSIVSLTGGSAGALYSDDDPDTTPADIVGAQGSWKLPLAQFDNRVNHAGKNCDGKDQARVRITEGHPVVALWFENDFTQGSALYRDAVPGAPQLNQMNTPLVMNASQTVGAACNSQGAIANDGAGVLINCSKQGKNASATWNRTASGLYWGDPVSSLDRLPVCTADLKANVRVLTPNGHAATQPSVYVCNGSVWAALGIDLDGNLNVPGGMVAGTMQLKTSVIEDASCTSSQVGTLARGASGEVLACQQRSPNANTQGVAYHWTRTNSSNRCQSLPKGYDLNSFYEAGSLLCADVEGPFGGPFIFPGSAQVKRWFVTSQSNKDNLNLYIYQTARDFFSAMTWRRSYQGRTGTWSDWVLDSDLVNRRVLKTTCGPTNRFPSTNYTMEQDQNGVLFTSCSIWLNHPGRWQISAIASKFTVAYLPTSLWINDTQVDVGGQWGDLAGAAQEILHGTSDVWVFEPVGGHGQRVDVIAKWGTRSQGAGNWGPSKISVMASYMSP